LREKDYTLDRITAGKVGEIRFTQFEALDNIFPEVNYRYSALSGAPVCKPALRIQIKKALVLCLKINLKRRADCNSALRHPEI